MTIQEYISYKSILAEEVNVQIIKEIICHTEKGWLAICVDCDPFWHRYEPRIYLELGEKLYNNQRLLERLLAII